MDDKKTTLEVIAPTVEEAIDKGLSELGLTREDVDIEVLDEGKRNIFRFAIRQARVRLSVKNPNQVLFRSTATVSPEVVNKPSEEIKLPESRSMPAVSSEELSPEELAVKETTQELLEKMGIQANVSLSYAQTEPEEKPVIAVNIEGDDLSFLIGRKAETLNALQYMLSLMISRKLNYWVPIQVDVQNYRTRRENELRKLARRTADQVVATGRKQILEPMPANERRIIHMTLRENTKIYTESSGEEPFRKVGVYPTEEHKS